LSLLACPRSSRIRKEIPAWCRHGFHTFLPRDAGGGFLKTESDTEDDRRRENDRVAVEQRQGKMDNRRYCREDVVSCALPDSETHIRLVRHSETRIRSYSEVKASAGR
jgi:hypothetical protein